MLTIIFNWGRRACACAVLSGCVIAAAPASAADATEPRDAQTVINQIRLKNMTKDLSLTPEQQKKIQALLADEAKLVTAVQNDEKLTMVEKYDKQMAIKKASREKMKPVLTDEQWQKWEAALAKAKKPKKPAAATAPAAPAAPDNEKPAAKP